MLLALVLMTCLGACVWLMRSALLGGQGTAGNEGGAERRLEKDVSLPPYDRDTGSEQDSGDADASDAQGPAARISENGISVSVRAGDLEQVATHLLTSYRDAHDCVLVSSGYLDLLGAVWGCVVQGDGWVDVCIVAHDAVAGRCRVSVLHMDADELAHVFEQDGAN